MKRESIETAIRYTRDWADVLEKHGDTAGASRLRRAAKQAEDEIVEWCKAPYEVIWTEEVDWEVSDLEQQMLDGDTGACSTREGAVLFPPARFDRIDTPGATVCDT